MIYLIRHAQSLANTGAISQADHTIPLSDLGQQQAAELVFWLPETRHVYTSQLLRTQQTAMPYCEHWRVSAQILPCLNEFSCLSLDLIANMTGEQRQPLTRAYWQRANPHERTGIGADTFAEFVQRVDDFRAKILPNGAVCFTHGIWIAMLKWRVNGGAADDMANFRAWQLALPMHNASVWQFDGCDVRLSETRFGSQSNFQAA